MAALTQLDLECLDFQTGFLSGLVMVSWGHAEQLNRYASHYANILALLGRTKESDYYSAVASAASSSIGTAAQAAWAKRHLRYRLFATTATRQGWQSAYTDSLLTEADDNLRRIADDVADFRTQIAHHFEDATVSR